MKDFRIERTVNVVRPKGTCTETNKAMVKNRAISSTENPSVKLANQ